MEEGRQVQSISNEKRVWTPVKGISSSPPCPVINNFSSFYNCPFKDVKAKVYGSRATFSQIPTRKWGASIWTQASWCHRLMLCLVEYKRTWKSGQNGQYSRKIKLPECIQIDVESLGGHEVCKQSTPQKWSRLRWF